MCTGMRMCLQNHLLRHILNDHRLKNTHKDVRNPKASKGTLLTG